MAETADEQQLARACYLERVLVGIREVIDKASRDELEKALRVISQRVGWALDGQAPSPRTEILEQIEDGDEDTVIEKTVLAGTLGLEVVVTVHQPGTFRLAFDPLEFAEKGVRSEE